MKSCLILSLLLTTAIGYGQELNELDLRGLHEINVELKESTIDSPLIPSENKPGDSLILTMTVSHCVLTPYEPSIYGTGNLVQIDGGYFRNMPVRRLW